MDGQKALEFNGQQVPVPLAAGGGLLAVAACIWVLVAVLRWRWVAVAVARLWAWAFVLMTCTALAYHADPPRTPSPSKALVQYHGFPLHGGVSALSARRDALAADLKASVGRVGGRLAALRARARPRDDAPADGFFALDQGLMDGAYLAWERRNATAGPTLHQWVPTSQCTPYGFVDLKRLRGAPPQTLPTEDSGFCRCGDGAFVGKRCGAVERAHGACAELCQRGGAAVFPTHRALAKEYAGAAAGAGKVKACVVTLTSVAGQAAYSRTLTFFEAMYNRRYGHPYVALLAPGDPIPRGYAAALQALVASEVVVGVVSPHTWDMPGGKGDEGARRRERYLAMYLAAHQALAAYDYFWHVPEASLLICPLYFDPFALMARENKAFGFFTAAPAPRDPAAEHAAQQKPWAPLLSVRGDTATCVFSDMHIGATAFFTSPAYAAFMEALEQAGAFATESGRAAAARTQALSALADAAQLYYFEAVAYDGGGRTVALPSDPTACAEQPVPERTWALKDKILCATALHQLANVPVPP
eukprot:TRINITY_DN13533_c0_g1_i1.p1 TRINITY_DN13533_c0_g1~~TRINITY_DN13533_c0_g1_i1.p1  ORF type:complete len:531 (+),score=146.65 TRINITY_DN13533_c0_g1_i1:191-1783(+)